MQLRDLSKPVTSKLLNENLAKKFGVTLNLESFSSIQLEDARNKLRTKLSEFEMNESYDSLGNNNGYQKTRMLLDTINQAIMEREMSDEEKQDIQDTKPTKKPIPNNLRDRAKSKSIPESWINSAISRMNIGEANKKELKNELKLRYDLNESTASWILLEGEEEKAEIIIATKDMIDRTTGWLEDIAAMKAEQLLELVDAVKREYGLSMAQQYSQYVRGGLESIYTALENARQELNNGLSIVSGTEEMMGDGHGNPMPTTQPTTDDSTMGEVPTNTPPTTGEEEVSTMPADREKRESIDYSRRLGIILNSQKKN